MGTFCPTCQTHQPFVKHLTKDQEPAVRGTDVIAHKLGCGHMVGGQRFMAFMEKKRDIEAAAARKIQNIREELNDKLASAWQSLSSEDKTGGAS